MNVKDRSADSDPPHSRGERGRIVYDSLHRKILELDLAPGSTLDETTLAEQFRMSRAPIREALTRLASQHLVVMAPNRTTIVAPLELTDFPRYAEALDLMQRANTRLAAQHRSDADIAGIRRLADQFDACLERYNPMEMSAANKAFHLAIAEAGGNRYLIRTYRELLDEGRRLLHLQFRFLQATGTQQPQAKDHHLMADAIEARDADRADALAHAHAEEFKRRFVRYLSHSGVDGMDLSFSPDGSDD